MLKYWLPLVIWMVVIFSASGDTQSFNRSSRILAPFIEFLFPTMEQENVDRLVTLARKGAHLTEYAVLSILFWRAVIRPSWRKPLAWNWKVAGLAVLFVALYAATDEFHQSTVPNRQGSAWDVLLDTIGGLGGVILLWIYWKFRNSRAPREANQHPASV